MYIEYIDVKVIFLNAPQISKIFNNITTQVRYLPLLYTDINNVMILIMLLIHNGANQHFYSSLKYYMCE